MTFSLTKFWGETGINQFHDFFKDAFCSILEDCGACLHNAHHTAVNFYMETFFGGVPFFII